MVNLWEKAKIVDFKKLFPVHEQNTHLDQVIVQLRQKDYIMQVLVDNTSPGRGMQKPH